MNLDDPEAAFLERESPGFPGPPIDEDRNSTSLTSSRHRHVWASSRSSEAV